MRQDLLLFAAELAKRGEPFAFATVVRREAPSSARVGDTALVTGSGAFHGWVGGSCTQPTVVREAQRAIAQRAPRLIALSPDPEADRRPGVDAFPMTCHSGGSVDIYIEPMLSAPRLVVFGASPVGQALARLGAAMGYAVDAVDPRADRSTFPEADRIFTAVDAEALRPPPKAEMPGAMVCAVVAAMGDGDEDAIRAALGLEPAYLGVVASRRRFAELRAALIGLGVPDGSLARIHCPAGIQIGAETPQEIALSVLGEIVQLRRTGAAALTATGTHPTPAGSPSVRPVHREAGARGAAPPVAGGHGHGGVAPATGEARDPVCGMSVTIAGARHTAVHEGKTWYFCGAGCRTRFGGDPARYAGAGAQS